MFPRIILSLSVSPALGALLGRWLLINDEELGWLIGLGTGIIFGFVLIILAMQGNSSKRRTVADLLLVIISIIALFEMLMQLNHVASTGSLAITGVVYILCLAAGLMRLVRSEQ